MLDNASMVRHFYQDQLMLQQESDQSVAIPSIAVIQGHYTTIIQWQL
jgi:hypothetical protein